MKTCCRCPMSRIAPPVRHPGDADKARMTVAEELAKIDALRGLDAEVAEAQEDVSGLADEALTWRLRAGRRRRATGRCAASMRTGPSTTLAANGARSNRDERERFDALLGPDRLRRNRER
ncbi:MAG: hypothetical protein U5K36_01685 [Roseovarius sp.]|nr:hypothetical protein [Roseovarius sp.]